MSELSRKLKHINLGIVGLIICFTGLIATFLEFTAELFFVGDAVQMNAINFVYLIINVLFYFYIGRMFLFASKNGDFMAARFGVTVFLITEYIMPAIRMMLFGGFIGAFFYLPYALLVGTAVGIGYFVVMILEYRQIGGNVYIPMTVLGSLLLVGNIALAVLNMWSAISLLMTTASTYVILLSIVEILGAIGQVLLGFLFFIYALYGLLRYKGRM